jgi:hypothetical protein
VLSDECERKCFRLQVILNVNDSGGFDRYMGAGSG